MRIIKKIILVGVVALALGGCATEYYAPYPDVAVYPAEVPTVAAYPAFGYDYYYGYYW
jgi:PBP1b-binding outer membrane lipoprotein LpoB